MRLFVGRKISEVDGHMLIEQGLGETYMREIVALAKSSREAAIHHFVRLFEWADLLGDTGLHAHIQQLEIRKSAIDFYGRPVWIVTAHADLSIEEYNALRHRRLQWARERGIVKTPVPRRGGLEG